MPSTQKPKVTLAQRLSGIQQIILADIRSTQSRLVEAINTTNFAEAQEAVEALQRMMRMRELAEELMKLARNEKASTTQKRESAQLTPTQGQETHPVSRTPAHKTITLKKTSAQSAPKTTPKKSEVATKEARSAPQKAGTKKTAPPQNRKATAEVSTSSETPAPPSPLAIPPTQEKRRGPVPRGLRTPERAFILPILQVLEEKGGQTDTDTLLEGVLKRMESILKPGDFETTSSTNQPRWKVSLYLARTTLLRQGLLRNDSPRGIWSLSDAGREFLSQHQSGK